MTYNLKDKVAIVTGAGRRGGIGAGIALRLAQEGAHVVLCDVCRSPSDLPHGGSGAWHVLTDLAEEIASMGVKSLPLRADVTEAASVQALVDETEANFGRLDILVNNAGAIIGPAPLLHMAEEAWRKTLEINTTGTFLCCQKALPLMVRDERGGRIINISSIAARKPRPYMSAYAASKAAVIALTQSLAQEVAEHAITVNAILPGDIDTGMKRWGLQLESIVSGTSEEAVTAALVGRIPAGRLGLPEDVAQMVAFLVSEEATFLTGQAFNVTGGRELT